jgi:YggT family protein
MTSSLIFLIRTVADLFLTLLLLRFFFQYLRVDFYNPISQIIYKTTAPITTRMQRLFYFLPIEVVCLILLLVFQLLYIWLMQQLYISAGLMPENVNLINLIFLAVKRTLNEALWIFTLSIFFQAVFSWFGSAYNSPMGRLFNEMNEPLLKPIRKYLPNSAGLDFSSLIVLILLNTIRAGITLPPYLM